MAYQKTNTTKSARHMRHLPTDVEQKLWYRLNNKQLAGLLFRLQHPIGPYIADLACVAAKLVIELDGGQHCENQHDIKRDAFLVSQGWHVLRFWNNQVNENLAGVLETILREATTIPAPTPTLPHLQGETGEGEVSAPHPCGFQTAGGRPSGGGSRS